MKYLIVFSLSVIFINACSKSSGTTSKVLVCNASYSINNLNASWNGFAFIPASTGLQQTMITGTAAAPYVKLSAGTNNMILNAGTTVLLDKNIYTSPNGGYSIIAYDTSATAPSSRVLVLSDDLTQPDTFSIKIRLLNCVPTTDTIDVWLVNNTNADSVRLDTANSYMGSNVLAASVQAFTTLKFAVKAFSGGSYTLKMKKTGTENILYASAAVLFQSREIYSLIFSGLPSGTGATGLSMNVLHLPQQ